MSNTHSKDYGAVRFYDLEGNMLFDTVEDYELWTSVDTEPSPDPKWVRVSVPGADGAVDLSRALAGQVTYNQRKIELRFIGSAGNHAGGVQLVRTMRSLLHGKRLRIVTMLTSLVDGYYVADCECDGKAYPDGTVVLDVNATAEPFIRLGTEYLTLPASGVTSPSYRMVDTVDAAIAKGAAYIVAEMKASAPTNCTPKNARSGKLWFARGPVAESINLLDLTEYSAVTYSGNGQGGYAYDGSAVSVGPEVNLGALSIGSYKYAYVSALKRTGDISDWPYSGGFPFLTGNGSNPTCYIGVYLTGKIDSVSNPTVGGYAHHSVLGTDDHGRPESSAATSMTYTSIATLAAGSYDDTLIGRLSVPTNTQNYPLSVLELVFSGITSSGLQVRLVAMRAAASLPAHWVEPSIGYVGIDFGGTFCRTRNSTDSALITAAEVSVTHNCGLLTSGYIGYALDTSYTTRGMMDGWLPPDAKLMSMTLTNAYGEDCPTVYLMAYPSDVLTVIGENGTMRSTPTLECGGHGCYIKIGDTSMVVGAGTHELDAITIGEGDFEVEYATIGYGSTDALLSWEGGVL